MLFSGINVVSIAVPDLASAREFYGYVLGLGEPLYDLPEAGWIEFGTEVSVTSPLDLNRRAGRRTKEPRRFSTSPIAARLCASCASAMSDATIRLTSPAM